MSLSSAQSHLRFWGVRGNIPTPGEDFLRYGGNTACVELCVGQHRLIFDGGTGLKDLGNALHQNDAANPVEAHLFFTHSHWDRIQGFPFFKPAFAPLNHLNIYGAIAMNGASIKQRLMEQMTRPGFPIPLHTMKAKLTFFDVSPSSSMTLPGQGEGEEEAIEIETGIINSADSSLGYRVAWRDRVVVYATDVENRDGLLNGVLLHLAQDADILIYDVTHPYYCTQSEQHNFDRVSFQNKLWKSALELIQATQVKRLILFHHDPWCCDQDLDEIAAELQIHCPQGTLAQEGMILNLSEI